MEKVDVKKIKTAKSYTNALFETAKDNNSTHKILNELDYIVNIINRNEDLNNFFDNPVVTREDKKDVISSVFKGIISKTTEDFLYLLADNGRLDLLNNILAEFTTKSDKDSNTERPLITSAIELSEEYKQKIIQKLESKLNSKVIPKFTLDPDIIGGLIIEVRDKTIDFSLKTKFKNITKQLTQG